MADRRCEQCGEAMPLLARTDARTCSTRCRMARHRARRREQPATVEQAGPPPASGTETIPVELRQVARWVRRSAAKVPLTTAGTAASSTRPATWSSYERTRAARAGVGLGFVLASGDDIVCIDLDHCLDGAGRPLPWAAAILDRCPPTWIERSAGGDGLHIWGRASWSGGRRLRRSGGGVEIYGDGRYIAVTGITYGSAPAKLGRLDDLISSLI